MQRTKYTIKQLSIIAFYHFHHWRATKMLKDVMTATGATEAAAPPTQDATKRKPRKNKRNTTHLCVYIG